MENARELLFQALFKYFLLKNDEHKMHMNQTYLTTCLKAYFTLFSRCRNHIGKSNLSHLERQRQK